MKTEVIKLDEERELSRAISRASEVLAGGGLVGFPTETVYGLAANVDQPDSLARLSQIKHRPAQKPYTLHLGDRAGLSRYVPALSLVDRQFLRKVWPGPLTVIFAVGEKQREVVGQKLPSRHFEALYHNNSIGIRLPDHPVARELLRCVDGPVVAPSANLAGGRPPTCAEEVVEQLGDEIDLLLDSGPTKYAKPSTIIRLSGDNMEVVREGVLDRGSLDRMRSVTLVFVCTGNSCRSPMAAGFCEQLLAEKLCCRVDQLGDKGYKIRSVGVMASEGSRAAPEAIQVCRELGVDISGHQAGLLTVEQLKQADYVFVMDRSHYHRVVSLEPEAADRSALLAGQDEIRDPIGMPLEVYRRSAAQIKQAVRERLNEIL